MNWQDIKSVGALVKTHPENYERVFHQRRKGV